jgi:predicted alpha/beta-fold hydrolase
MLKAFQLALAACAAVGVSLGGAHVVSVYGETMLTSKVKSITAAEAAAMKPSVVEGVALGGN